MRKNSDINFDDEEKCINYYYFNKAFSLEEIQKIHDVASNYEYFTAETHSKKEGNEDLEQFRKSKIKWLNAFNSIWVSTEVFNLLDIDLKKLYLNSLSCFNLGFLNYLLKH